MKTLLTVREYAWLTTSKVELPSLDRRQVSPSAFDWLCRLNSSLGRAGATLTQLKDQHWLRLENYVGVIATPCGTQLEILPKHFEEGDSFVKSRQLMLRMIKAAFDLPTKDVGEANLQLSDAPLSEWVIRQFLRELDHLIKRGMRFQYQVIDEEQQFIRGQLDRAKQLRQRPERQHYFHIRHDFFTPNRPENRLLRLALESVCRATRQPVNWRLANELRSLLVQIPISNDVLGDFVLWRNDRIMGHYRRVRPWCELILNQHMPSAVAGNWRGISLLFPMEKLFERYVAASLKRELNDTAVFRNQPNSKYLCKHDGNSIFRLQPDMLIDNEKSRWVLDTKWKLLDASNRKNNYGMKQSDFYQLFAYSNAYLSDDKHGHLVLIYPKGKAFPETLPSFDFSDNLKLWAIPFDLECARLERCDSVELPLKEQ